MNPKQNKCAVAVQLKAAEHHKPETTASRSLQKNLEAVFIDLKNKQK